MAYIPIPNAILLKFALFSGNSTRMWRTNGPTDRRTDKPSYRDTRTHLKTVLSILFDQEGTAIEELHVASGWPKIISFSEFMIILHRNLWLPLNMSCIAPHGKSWLQKAKQIPRASVNHCPNSQCLPFGSHRLEMPLLNSLIWAFFLQILEIYPYEGMIGWD